MAKLQLVSPWINFYHELQAFFRNDRDVTVIFDEEETEVKLFVNGADKADALTKLLPESRKFGSVTLKITVAPTNAEPQIYSTYRRHPHAVRRYMNETQEMFSNAFYGNPAFVFTDKVDLQTNEIIYIVFRNEVVQYYNDDLGDYYGQCSTLYQNIAADIFNPFPGVHYCTNKYDRPEE